MTNKAQEAYMRGFCKTAEAHGVDPHGLYKYAQNVMARILARAGRGTWNYGKRYLNLLFGGNKGELLGVRRKLGRDWAEWQAIRRNFPGDFGNDSIGRLNQGYVDSAKTNYLKSVFNYRNEADKVTAARLAPLLVGTGAYAMHDEYGDD